MRAIHRIVNGALKVLLLDFDARGSPFGRVSILAERRLRVLLLRGLYAIGSERQFIERGGDDMVLRWCVGRGIGDSVCNAGPVATNDNRRFDGEGLRSSEPCSVRGTVLAAWVNPKSFRPKDGSGTRPRPRHDGGRHFDGGSLRNKAHASTPDATPDPTTDATTAADARLSHKESGEERRRCCIGRALIEHRSRLIVDAVTTRASGQAERLAAIGLIKPRAAGRPARHAIAQRVRKRIEEAFGWAKTVAGLRKMRHRRLPQLGCQVTPAIAARNLGGLPELLAHGAGSIGSAGGGWRLMAFPILPQLGGSPVYRL